MSMSGQRNLQSLRLSLVLSSAVLTKLQTSILSFCNRHNLQLRYQDLKSTN